MAKKLIQVKFPSSLSQVLLSLILSQLNKFLSWSLKDKKMIIHLTQSKQVRRVISSIARKKMTNFLISTMSQISKIASKLIFFLLKNNLIKKSSPIKRKVKVRCKIPARFVGKLILSKKKKISLILGRKMCAVKLDLILIGCLNTLERYIWCRMTTEEPLWILLLLKDSSIRNELTNYRL